MSGRRTRWTPGTVFVYLDGKNEPVIEMELTEMLGGGKGPFIKPISIELAKGWNTYLPIPYAKHCKVTTSKPDFYYHIDYRTYPRAPKVETYSDEAGGEATWRRSWPIAKKLEDPETAVTAPDRAAAGSGGRTHHPAGRAMNWISMGRARSTRSARA
jgi:hypothetical protein